jgi:hypothetical protein
MSDEDKSYQYPNDENKEKHPTGPFNGTESYKTIFKNKRLLLSLAGILAFYGIMGAWAYFHKNEKKVEEKITTKKIDKTEMPKIDTPAEPVVQHETHVQPAPYHQTVDIGETADHSQEIQELKNDISMIRRSVNRNNQAQQNSAQAQKQTADQLQKLNEQLLSLTKQLQPVLTDLAKKNETKEKVRVNFSIRAIQEGRAWIQNDRTGATMTVKVGDALTDYGKVISIIPKLGVVQTNSGRIIQFSDQ